MYIVTGGAGLIGSAIVWELNRRGIDDILVVDHLGTSEKWKNLRALHFADYMEKGEFRQRFSSGHFAPSAIDGIIHMGACSATTELDASYLIDNNFDATRELAAFAYSHEVRFVYASSCATYGDGAHGYLDNESTIHELRPLNMYGYSKQLFDLWARREGYFDRIIGCKFSNVYGPNEWHKDHMRSVVCRAYEDITSQGCVKLFKSYKPEYGDGEQKRDFLYVKDAARMVLYLFDHPDARGLYNIGSGRAESWNALARAAFKALEVPERIEYIDMPETLRPRYQYYTLAAIDKLRALGYEAPVTSLEDAVHDYLCHYTSLGRHLGDEEA